MIRRIGSVIAALLALASPLAAQTERWQVALGNDRYVWDIRLVRLEGDSLVVRQSDTLARVPVAQITEIRLIRKSKASLADGAGAGARSALVGADDEVYDLAPLDFAGRLRTVRKILLLHPTEP